MTLTFKTKVHFKTGDRGGKRLSTEAKPIVEPGRVPWISKYMALAIKFDGLVRSGVVTYYAELARLGHVTSAMITRIMNLTLLGPDIQEELLFLPRIERGKARIRLKDVLPVAAEPNWREQRRLFAEYNVIR